MRASDFSGPSNFRANAAVNDDGAPRALQPLGGPTQLNQLRIAQTTKPI